MQNFKTDIEKIFFRSSNIGLLAGGLIRHGLTEKQREEMEQLDQLRITPIGLTSKQQSDLDSWDKKVKDGNSLTPSQMEKRDDYKSRLTTPKGLTPTQEARLKDLQERNSRKPELSEGAKTFVNQVWLENEKEFHEDVTDKKLRKGIQGEEDAINLISFVDGVLYSKNSKRVYKTNITGECDIDTYFKEIDRRIIDDTKCSWNPRTFMQSDLTTAYEWQGRAYLYLYDADIFRLRHCLVNCPPEVFADEYKKYCFMHGIIDDSMQDYKPLLRQFFRNYIYDFEEFEKTKRLYPVVFWNLTKELEPLYTLEERVKTFMFERDNQLEEVLLKSVELAIEYYKTITLNMI